MPPFRIHNLAGFSPLGSSQLSKLALRGMVVHSCLRRVNVFSWFSKNCYSSIAQLHTKEDPSHNPVATPNPVGSGRAPNGPARRPRRPGEPLAERSPGRPPGRRGVSPARRATRRGGGRPKRLAADRHAVSPTRRPARRATRRVGRRVGEMPAGPAAWSATLSPSRPPGRCRVWSMAAGVPGVLREEAPCCPTPNCLSGRSALPNPLGLAAMIDRIQT